MKKSVKLVFLLIILGIIVMGCEMMPQKEEIIDEPATGLTGKQGLKVSFMPNIPPPVLYSGEDILIMLLAENKGTATVTKATTYLSGFDTTIIKLEKEKAKKELPQKLEGRGPFRGQGDTTQLDYPLTKIQLPGTDVDKYNTIILATTCYKYETKAGASICIDPNPYTTTRQTKVCTPTNIELGTGQGAPIAVTKIEVDPTKGTTRFRIHIENIGKGTVYEQSKIEQCSPYDSKGLNFADVNLIKVEEVSAAGQDLKIKCKPQPTDKLRLVNDKGILYCEMNTKDFASSTFTTPISIKLSYGYRDTTTKQIEVRKA